jgi:hypothetical protein
MVKRVHMTLMAVGVMSTVVACNSAPDDRKDLEAFAKTALADAEAEAAKKAEEEARKKAVEELEAKKKAEAAKHVAELDALATLPEDMPKKLDKACDGVVDAYTEFIKQTYADDAKELMLFYDNKRKRLGERRVKCEKVASVEAAACQARALLAASETPELAAKWKGQGLEIMAHCVDKFAPEAAKQIAEAERAAKSDGSSAPVESAGGEQAG